MYSSRSDTRFGRHFAALQVCDTDMLHGPCGTHNSSAIYSGAPPDNPDAPNHLFVCSKKYPKKFCETAVNGKDSYPVYRRRDDGRKFIKELQATTADQEARWFSRSLDIA